MILPINEDRRIEFTKHEVQLQKRQIAQTDTKKFKKGEESWVAYKFCSTIGGAIRCMEHEMYADSGAETLEECIQTVAEVLDTLSAVLKPEYTITASSEAAHGV